MSEQIGKKPRKWNSVNYPKAIVVRVTEDEHSQINERAELARMSTSRYLVHCGLKNHAPQMREQGRLKGEEREVMERLIYEIHKVGGNLNQLTYGLNTGLLTGGGVPSKEEISRGVRLVTEVLAAARELLK